MLVAPCNESNNRFQLCHSKVGKSHTTLLFGFLVLTPMTLPLAPLNVTVISLVLSLFSTTPTIELDSGKVTKTREGICDGEKINGALDDPVGGMVMTANPVLFIKSSTLHLATPAGAVENRDVRDCWDVCIQMFLTGLEGDGPTNGAAWQCGHWQRR